VLLPAGLVAVVAVTFPIHWAVLLFKGLDQGDSFGLSNLPAAALERMGYAFFNPLTFIYVGTRVAPSYRIQTAVVLMVLWAMAIGAVLMYGATSGAYSGLAWAEFAAIGVLGVAGVLTGGYNVLQRS
jgi:hypothetical protein